MDHEFLNNVANKLLFGQVLLAMAIAMFICGLNLLRHNNTLLGLEYFILAISPFAGFLWTQGVYAENAYDVWRFLDYFSRLLGSTILICLGLMKATHGLKLSKTLDVFLLTGSLLLTYGMLQVPLLKSAFPFLYIITGVFLIVSIAILAYQLFQHKRPFYGCLAVLAILLLNFIGLIEDFIHYPKVSITILNQPYIELICMIVAFVALMLAYLALENAKQKKA